MRLPTMAAGVASLFVCVSPAFAADPQATMQLTSPTGPGAEIGTVKVVGSSSGAQFMVDLHGLPPGPHGFHVHDAGSCAPATNNGQIVPAGAAGGHYDPQHSGHHEGPDHDGHLGDLPVLMIDKDGTSKQVLTAPRIKDVAVLKGHALMIHVGGDNYGDDPLPLGGGGARLACGLIE